MSNNITDHLAVLIDAENISARYADRIFEEIATLGDARLRRIYGDFSNGKPQGWTTDIMAKYSIVLHHRDACRKGKNSSDIALIIDAMDILHSGEFSGFVLVSSDSDFTHLANRIRKQGLNVFGIGQIKVSRYFQVACDQFIDVDNIRKSGVQSDLLQNVDVVSKSVNSSTVPKPKKHNLNHVIGLIRKIIKSSTEACGWLNLSIVGHQLNIMYPDFDSRAYGHEKLSNLIRATGQFEESVASGFLKIRCRRKAD